ncbi:hypothetical protein K440DRAFT_614913 [Wilcoxina mikolae CBS 423.85]|nr:hypothetical protein K440DRAFT_614913 [Wilcoxina mikolae CBS 423.85]
MLSKETRETRTRRPGLAQGSTYHHEDYWELLSEQYMTAENPDPAAIWEEYAQRQHSPMESFLEDTSRDVRNPSFSHYNPDTQNYGYQQSYHEPIQTQQPAYLWENPYSLGRGASDPEFQSAPPVIMSPVPDGGHIFQPHFWNDSVSDGVRHMSQAATSNYDNSCHDDNYAESYGNSPYTPNSYAPANGQFFQEPTTPSPKPSGSAYFYCPEHNCNKIFANINHLKKHWSCHAGKMIQCPICHKRYSRKDTILRHLKDIHQMDSVAAKRLADELDERIDYEYEIRQHFEKK